MITVTACFLRCYRTGFSLSAMRLACQGFPCRVANFFLLSSALPVFLKTAATVNDLNDFKLLNGRLVGLVPPSRSVICERSEIQNFYKI
ncbi:hypothetical protein OND84_001060 [Morganella morganii]|nr:hypothetical protein [Morganella morganii]